MCEGVTCVFVYVLCCVARRVCVCDCLLFTSDWREGNIVCRGCKVWKEKVKGYYFTSSL